jgi:hypothetical protein
MEPLLLGWLYFFDHGRALLDEPGWETWEDIVVAPNVINPWYAPIEDEE